jgi:hypothetical protein
MKKFILLLILVSLAPVVFSRGYRSGNHRSPSSTEHKKTIHVPNYTGSSSNVARDSDGRIKRSPAARASFMRSNPCPTTGKKSGGCPGYVVDHVKPLAKGGADDPSNMQWQTKEAAKEKDKWERK